MLASAQQHANSIGKYLTGTKLYTSVISRCVTWDPWRCSSSEQQRTCSSLQACTEEGIFQIILSAPCIQCLIPMLKPSGEEPAGSRRFLSLRGCHHLAMSTSWEGCELKTGLNGLSVMREYTGVCSHREHTGLTLSQKGFADWDDHS